MSGMIRSIVCERPGVLAEAAVPIPRRRGGEALVKIRRVGLCGTDFHIYEGLHPFVQYPRIMGHELSGEVVEVGDSSAFKMGDLVIVNPYIACGFCIACRNCKPNCCTKIEVLGVHRDGGMCEYIAVPEKNLIDADGLSADEAATVEFLAIGAHAIRRANVSTGHNLLVLGAGPIGLGVAIFAQIAGATVTILDRDQGRLKLAQSVTGIHRLIEAEGAAQAVATATGGEGFDIVVDATGNLTSIENGFAYVAHGGSYVLVSIVKGSISFNDAEFHKREMMLIGSRNATRMDFDHVTASIRSGRVPVNALITHRTTPTEAIGDIPRWSADKRDLVKALIVY